MNTTSYAQAKLHQNTKWHSHFVFGITASLKIDIKKRQGLAVRSVAPLILGDGLG
ncbi:hypothetical protein [Pseudanabaena minima]|uniref:hypothetical protein n=1 Tax=Pseudanabaena minima TaxID=890415 RepID=UPI003DA87009